MNTSLSEMSFREAPGLEQRDLLVEPGPRDDGQAGVDTEGHVLLSKLNYWMIEMVQPCNKMYFIELFLLHQLYLVWPTDPLTRLTLGAVQKCILLLMQSWYRDSSCRTEYPNTILSALSFSIAWKTASEGPNSPA